MPDKKASPAAWIAGAALAVVAAAILVSFLASARKRSNLGRCSWNLVQIGIALRGGDLFDSPRWDGLPCGRAFLAGRERWPMRQRRELDLACPVRGGRDIGYRGPARSLRQIGLDEPVCADRPGNHGPGAGGNVLRKTGEVVAAAEGDPLWSLAAQTTSD